MPLTARQMWMSLPSFTRCLRHQARVRLQLLAHPHRRPYTRTADASPRPVAPSSTSRHADAEPAAIPTSPPPPPSTATGPPFRPASAATATATAAASLPPSPRVPAPLARSLFSLASSLPDLSMGMHSLSAGRASLAVSLLSRAADIVQRLDDPYARIAVHRLLAAAYHEAGEWRRESAVRVALLEAGLRDCAWPTGGGEDQAADELRLLHFQHASSYIALQGALHEPADGRALRTLLETAVRDQNPAWRANILALQTMFPQPAGQPVTPSQRVDEYQRILELLQLSEQNSRSLPPRPRSPLIHLLHIGDLRCLLAAHLHSAGDTQQATSQYQQSRQYWATRPLSTYHGDDSSSVGSALPLMCGGWQVAEAAALCGAGESSRAVQVTEEQLGASHPSLAVALRSAALQQQSDGEAIVAEGLLRASIGQLESHVAQPERTLAMHVSPADLRLELLTSQWQYAQLLSRLEWNGRSRKAEAKHWIGKIVESTDRHTYLVPQWQHLQEVQSAVPTAQTSMPRWLVERFSL